MYQKFTALLVCTFFAHTLSALTWYKPWTRRKKTELSAAQQEEKRLKYLKPVNRYLEEIKRLQLKISLRYTRKNEKISETFADLEQSEKAIEKSDFAPREKETLKQLLIPKAAKEKTELEKKLRAVNNAWEMRENMLADCNYQLTDDAEKLCAKQTSKELYKKIDKDLRAAKKALKKIKGRFYKAEQKIKRFFANLPGLRKKVDPRLIEALALESPAAQKQQKKVKQWAGETADNRIVDNLDLPNPKGRTNAPDEGELENLRQQATQYEEKKEFDFYR